MNTQAPTQKFECHALVELMGHQQMAGFISEQTFGPATFFRVTVPETSEGPSFDRILNPAAIYAINPVTEEVAKARAEQIRFKPLTGWDIRQMTKPVNDETGPRRLEGHDDDDDDDERYPM